MPIFVKIKNKENHKKKTRKPPSFGPLSFSPPRLAYSSATTQGFPLLAPVFRHDDLDCVRREVDLPRDCEAQGTVEEILLGQLRGRLQRILLPLVEELDASGNIASLHHDIRGPYRNRGYARIEA